MAKQLKAFKTKFPETWAAYQQLRDHCDHSGPLDGKTVELIKVGISAALEHEGGLVAHVSQAQKAGASDDEIYQAILVATGLAGFPAALAAYGYAADFLKPKKK
ncbi:MAG TPA: carboxymuconolactone decarboxylase family protein [bacterium]|jgi:AhpD family alkylhydroperoxidase